MKNWSQKQTQLLKKCVYNLAGLYTYVTVFTTGFSIQTEFSSRN